MDFTYAAIIIPMISRNDAAVWAKLEDSAESIDWKSAVNLFKIRPVGTVSSHLSGVLSTLLVICLNTVLDAEKDPL